MDRRVSANEVADTRMQRLGSIHVRPSVLDKLTLVPFLGPDLQGPLLWYGYYCAFFGKERKRRI